MTKVVQINTLQLFDSTEKKSGVVQRRFLSSQKTSHLLSISEFNLLVQDCTLGKRECQKKMYIFFYDYLMSVCLRYGANNEDALEILNDTFLKVFKEIGKFKAVHADPIADFKGWTKRIAIHTAIDHFRKYDKHNHNKSMDDAFLNVPDIHENQLDRLTYKEIIACVQQLSHAYRVVFSLFVLDGFTHDEISKQLGIAIGTSKSNLNKARQQLQQMLMKKVNYTTYERTAVR